MRPATLSTTVESIYFLMLSDVIQQAQDLTTEVRSLDLSTVEADYFHNALNTIEHDATELLAQCSDDSRRH
jgi:hypothetical protein